MKNTTKKIIGIMVSLHIFLFFVSAAHAGNVGANGPVTWMYSDPGVVIFNVGSTYAYRTSPKAGTVEWIQNAHSSQRPVGINCQTGNYSGCFLKDMYQVR